MNVDMSFELHGSPCSPLSMDAVKFPLVIRRSEDENDGFCGLMMGANPVATKLPCTLRHMQTKSAPCSPCYSPVRSNRTSKKKKTVSFEMDEILDVRHNSSFSEVRRQHPIMKASHHQRRREARRTDFRWDNGCSQKDDVTPFSSTVKRNGVARKHERSLKTQIDERKWSTRR